MSSKVQNRSRLTLLVSVVLGIFLVSLATACGAATGEQQAVVRGFMQAAVAKDIDTAYGYWSSKGISKEEISDFINNNYDELFGGYKDIDISGFSSSTSGGVSTTELSGSVIYTVDFKDETGRVITTKDMSFGLAARLIKEGDVWKLTDLNLRQ